MGTRDNAATCARCTPGGAGLCADHLRKRAAVIRGSARRAEGLRAYADRLATIAGQGRDHVLDDGNEIAAHTVALRGML
jgi:hypothetical protein